MQDNLWWSPFHTEQKSTGNGLPPMPNFFHFHQNAFCCLAADITENGKKDAWIAWLFCQILLFFSLHHSVSESKKLSFPKVLLLFSGQTTFVIRSRGRVVFCYINNCWQNSSFQNATFFCEKELPKQFAFQSTSFSYCGNISFVERVRSQQGWY